MRFWRAAAGWSLLGAGLVMLVTPGPGLLTMAGGLAILAREHEWARKLLERVRREIDRRRNRKG